MRSSFPSFVSDPQSVTKRCSLFLIVVTFCLLLMLSYEAVGYFHADNLREGLAAKIDRYHSLVAEVSNEGNNEALYFAFKAKLHDFEGVIAGADPIDNVFNYFESRLDSESAVDRILYDTQKVHALVYVKSGNPAAFERSIIGDEDSRSRVSILSKQQYNKDEYKMVYELRVGL